MSKPLLHLYGPFGIQVYGLTIAIGVAFFTWLCLQHPLRKRFVTIDQFLNLLFVGVICGIIGGRLLFVVYNWSSFTSIAQMFYVWQGGLSVLGAILSLLVVIPLYLHKNKVPILPILDLVGLHTPLAHCIARIGCFFAGCCYGAPTNLFWGITYTDPESYAPLCIALHPTQLYSSFILLALFISLYIAQKWIKKTGQLFACYLMGIGFERFVVDFLRADREFITTAIGTQFSVHQLISAGLFVFGLALFLVIQRTNKSVY